MYVTRNARRVDLESDFNDFLKNQLGALSLDEEGDKEKRPDFLWREKLLIEIKTLKISPQAKVERIFEAERVTDDWPLAFGTMNAKHLEGSEIYKRNSKRLLKAVQSTIRDHLKKANKQIREYCEVRQKNFGSVVIILNEDLSEYTPEVVVNAVERELRSAETQGRTGYDSLDSVVYISEKHYIGIPRAPFAAYFIGHLLNSKESQLSQSDTVQLLDDWGKRSSAQPLSVFPGDGKLSSGEIEVLAERIPRHEIWRIEYRKTRGMRGYSKKRLTIEFCKIFMLQTLAGVKGAPRVNMPNALFETMQPFANVLEELSIRGVDMETIVPTRSVQKKAIRELLLTAEERSWLERNFIFHANGQVHTLVD